MKTLSYSFLSIIILVFSPSVFAAYYWSAYQSNSYKSGTAAGSIELYRQSLEGGSCNVEATTVNITYSGDNKATGYFETYYNCNGNTGTGQFNTWRTAYTPPDCNEGQVYNEETMSCETPPEEICFTTIESMASQCVYIGEDDPADEVPPGCVVDSETGHEICLSDEPGCYIADGKTICPTPDMVCGTKNGTFSCVAPEAEGCGYFNGEKVCFAPDGEKVDNTSPDHPDNGGNLDGDETNDMIDSRPPSEGGDPDNQIDSPIAPTEPGDEATEKTARDQLKELKKINDALDEMGKGEPLKGDEASSKIDDAIPGLLDNTGIDGLTDGLGSNPFGSGDLGTLPGIADGLMPQGTCIAYSQDIIGFGTFQITCDDTALLRTILSWLFYVITAIYLFQLATTPVRS